MADCNTAKGKAYSLLRQYMNARLTLDDLVQIADEQGYTVIDFSQTGKEGNVETLIRELGLDSFARNGKSFVYRNKDVRLLFLCDTMTAKEKLYAMAHELGHIYCGHLRNGACCNAANMEEEHEANEFAHYLLHPAWYEKILIRIYKKKVLAIIVVAVLVLGIVSIPVISQIQLSKSYYGEYYVTENGEKYHVVYCPVIKDKKNAHRLTIEEYESGKYEACQICLQDGTN